MSTSLHIPQEERLVLILVCAGAAVIVLTAVISAALVVRRMVYRTRWDSQTSAACIHTCARADHLCFFVFVCAGNPSIVSPTCAVRMTAAASQQTCWVLPAATVQCTSRNRITCESHSEMLSYYWACGLSVQTDDSFHRILQDFTGSVTHSSISLTWWTLIVKTLCTKN